MDFARAWFSDETLAALELACGEALANSVEHGGGPTLDVVCSFADDALTVEIRHEGKGFEPPPTVAAPPRGSLRGYGMYIIHEVLDGVEYVDGGTGLRLSLKAR
ncbi:MAG: ATP-binding protein [Candidatus Eremiobacteraeota bacterium]|nr:ATP-binding protein [Candidatus Eremiobacteraeota bacterium]